MAGTLVAAVAAAEPSFVLEDLKGDDHGTGALIYPNRDDMQQGDLDLVSFEAEERGDGIWFTVEMGQPIRGMQPHRSDM